MGRTPRPGPGSHELLVRVVATTVNSGDWRVRALHLPPGFGPLGRLALGLRRPRQPILGTEFAGAVEDTGVLACRFRPVTVCSALQGHAWAAMPNACAWTNTGR